MVHLPHDWQQHICGPDHFSELSLLVQTRGEAKANRDGVLIFFAIHFDKYRDSGKESFFGLLEAAFVHQGLGQIDAEVQPEDVPLVFYGIVFDSQIQLIDKFRAHPPRKWFGASIARPPPSGIPASGP
jgi:hypothetical protein